MKNKQGLWKLSPSALYAFTECPACFWMNNHVGRTPMFPLVLNTAMDSILKNRYDKYRTKKTFPPEAAELSRAGLRPFLDVKTLNLWREKYTPLQITDKKAGYVLRGKIDDVLLEKDGSLVPADYKSSGKAPKPDKQKYYRDQLTAYALMFKEHGHRVSKRAYLLHYFVADQNNPDLLVKFDAHVDRVAIDIAALRKKLAAMVRLLNKPFPGYRVKTCKKCRHYAEHHKAH